MTLVPNIDNLYRLFDKINQSKYLLAQEMQACEVTYTSFRTTAEFEIPD